MVKSVLDRVSWTDIMVCAFNALCNALCDHVILYLPKPADNFTAFTNAYSKGVGGVLYEYRDGVKYPVGCYSRQLRGPEQCDTATELEGL